MKTYTLMSLNGSRSVTIFEEERKDSQELGNTVSVRYYDKELLKLKTGLFKEDKKVIKKFAKIKIFNNFIAISTRQEVFNFNDTKHQYSNSQIDTLYTFDGTELCSLYHSPKEKFKPIVKWTEEEIEKIANNMKVKSKSKIKGERNV